MGAIDLLLQDEHMDHPCNRLDTIKSTVGMQKVDWLVVVQVVHQNDKRGSRWGQEMISMTQILA
jgi:hypothetical protein